MTTKRESKRILSVKVERVHDTDGEADWLGKFSDDASDYAIVARGEHEGLFYDSLPCDECGSPESEHTECDDGLGDSSQTITGQRQPATKTQRRNDNERDSN